MKNCHKGLPLIIEYYHLPGSGNAVNSCTVSGGFAGDVQYFLPIDDGNRLSIYGQHSSSDGHIWKGNHLDGA